jgi:hypothetical protein
MICNASVCSLGALKSHVLVARPLTNRYHMSVINEFKVIEKLGVLSISQHTTIDCYKLEPKCPHEINNFLLVQVGNC